MEAVRTQVVELVGASILHLVLFAGLSLLGLEVGKICEAGRTLA